MRVKELISVLNKLNHDELEIEVQMNQGDGLARGVIEEIHTLDGVCIIECACF